MSGEARQRQLRDALLGVLTDAVTADHVDIAGGIAIARSILANMLSTLPDELRADCASAVVAELGEDVERARNERRPCAVRRFH